MEEHIKYLGSHRPKSEDFLRSNVTINGDSYHVWDAVGVTEDGHNFARLLPNVANGAELVNLVQDGDLIGYIRQPMTISWPCNLDAETALGILKGRVSHTELGYAGDGGSPMQTSIFNEPGPRVPRDRPIYEDFDNAALGIYRASLANYEITPQKEAALKAEVKRWKRIVQPVIFPCKEMDTDPVDFTTVEAMGVDMNGNQLWSKTLNSTSYRRTVCENSAGFHMGQNIVAWVNSSNGGIYGQNIGPDGNMGPIEPVLTCFPPENLEGDYIYDMDEQVFGVKLSWTAPETLPLHYNLYRYSEIYKDEIIIEVEADATTYFDESGIGAYTYQLTAVNDNCESDFALTPEGENHVKIEVTGIEENTDSRIVNVLNVYNMTGQRITVNDMNELNTGVYILQGLTSDGRLVNEKVMVDRKEDTIVRPLPQPRRRAIPH